MNRLGSIPIYLVCGSLGAVLSVTLLLLTPIDSATHGYSEIIVDNLPALVFATGMGFGVGLMIALLWSVLQRIFAVKPRAPNA